MRRSFFLFWARIFFFQYFYFILFLFVDCVWFAVLPSLPPFLRSPFPPFPPSLSLFSLSLFSLPFPGPINFALCLMAYARKRRLQLLESARASVCFLLDHDVPQAEDAFLTELTTGSLLIELYQTSITYAQSLPASAPGARFTIPGAAPSTPADACGAFGAFCRACGASDAITPSYKDLTNEADINKCLTALTSLQSFFKNPLVAGAYTAMPSPRSTPTLSSASPSPAPTPTPSPRLLPSPPEGATSPLARTESPLAMNPSYNRRDVSALSGSRQLQRAQDRTQREMEEQREKEEQWRRDRGTPTPELDPAASVIARATTFPRPMPPTPASSSSPTPRSQTFPRPAISVSASSTASTTAAVTTTPSSAVFRAKLVSPPPSPATFDSPSASPIHLVVSSTGEDSSGPAPDMPDLEKQPAKGCLVLERSDGDRRRLQARVISFAPEPPKLERSQGQGMTGFVSRKQQEQNDNIAARLAARQERLDQEAQQNEEEAEAEEQRSASLKRTATPSPHRDSPAARLASSGSPARSATALAQKRLSQSGSRTKFASGTVGYQSIEVGNDFDEQPAAQAPNTSNTQVVATVRSKVPSKPKVPSYVQTSSSVQGRTKLRSAAPTKPRGRMVRREQIESDSDSNDQSSDEDEGLAFSAVTHQHINVNSI